jgi:aminopeptidase
MRDQRAQTLAQILVQYSTAVKPGDVCVIQGSSSGEPLILAIYEEILRAGGNPIVQMSPEEAVASYYALASDDQLDWVSPTATWLAENADVGIVMVTDPACSGAVAPCTWLPAAACCAPVPNVRMLGVAAVPSLLAAAL